MRFESTPLGARCAYAMSMVLAPLDPDRSLDYLAVAIECAHSSGLFSDSDRVPLLLVSVEVLREAFLDGLVVGSSVIGEEHLVAQSPWKTSGGPHRTRVRIIESSNLYRAEVEVAFSGGDCELVEVGHYPSQAVAQQQAELHELVWHDHPKPASTDMATIDANLGRLGVDLTGLPEGWLFA